MMLNYKKLMGHQSIIFTMNIVHAIKYHPYRPHLMSWKQMHAVEHHIGIAPEETFANAVKVANTSCSNRKLS